ncbi:glycosyltransferase [Bordetella sp. FB-8]|uniref:glycosyltransferase n=1 Tax=Bordetella sp. FB-8 TaxID=1159870 RepID=UPI00047751D0|nr:glycosyltransferase [Bordetella sp. FB-8]
MNLSTPCRIAVLIPCLNEAQTITDVVSDFQRVLPDALIYVFDNNSTDDTVKCAREAGAMIREVRLRGKGNVIRRMFADVEADIYVMVDGDGTYAAEAAVQMIEKLRTEGLDMVVGARKSEEQAAYRFGHQFGNILLTRCVASVFGDTFTDMLSGYRVFSRRYVKSFPAHASGFETETELTVHALELRMPVGEITTVYKARPEGSASKLNTYRDGFRILVMIARLFRTEKPLTFFSLGAAICALFSIVLAIPLFVTYLQIGLVPRYPTAMLCAALMLLGMLFLVCGLILDTVTRGRIEAKQLAYLMIPGPGS